MTPLDIQYALKKRGITQSRIALDLGVRDISVSDVIHKKMVSDRIMRAVAAALGVDVAKVFPEYYMQPPKRKTSKVLRVA